MTCLVDSIIGYTLFSLIKCLSTRLRDGTVVTRPALEERERESERQRRKRRTVGSVSLNFNQRNCTDFFSSLSVKV